MDKNVKRPCAF